MNPPRSFVETTPRASSPVVEVVEIRDPTAAGEGAGVLIQEVVQLETKPLRARRILVRLDQSLVVLHSTNLRVRARTTLRDRMLAFVVFGPQAGGMVNGLPLRPDLIMAAQPGIQVEFVVEPEYESVTVVVPPDALESQFVGRQREARLRSPVGVEVLDATPSHARELFGWGKRLTTAAARQPSLFDGRRETLAAAQTELMELLLAALEGTTAPHYTRSDQTRQVHGRVVRLAEEYALAHSGDCLYVKDLCVAAGVSERSLEYAFREVMGLSPVAYLTRLRLHRVRQALRMADHGSTTVSAEALNWGFWHFGEFSRAYKSCFGELPSETLRRRTAEEDGK